MGLFFSSTYNKWYKNRETKLLMNGLDMSGKTTILNTLKLSKYIKIDAHIGYDIEEIRHDGFSLYCWDVGGAEIKYPNWRKQYYQNVHGLIFVIDCSNIYRIDEACDILRDIFENEELGETILLVFANRIDTEKSLSIEELENKLKLKFLSDHEYHIQEINAISGDGLYEGLDWLGEQINKKFP